MTSGWTGRHKNDQISSVIRGWVYILNLKMTTLKSEYLSVGIWSRMRPAS
jgi:hypothetical protein